jgi:hypothetical protein
MLTKRQYKIIVMKSMVTMEERGYFADIVNDVVVG